MKVALVGASGNVGSRLLAELVRRGHEVTAIARHPEKIEVSQSITPAKGDLFDDATLAPVLSGHEAVISSVRFMMSDPHKLLNAVRASGVKRYLVVGGAGSLEAAPGVKLMDTPKFPAAAKPEATMGAEFLELLRQERDLDWTFASPSAVFGPGERTGTFRLGTDQLLINEKGSSISYEDFAIALVDELEHPKYSRTRFTVGY
jgi:putative NADH-flavin reductase